MFDLVIKNGLIIDGTGSPAYHADIGIRDGVIERIGKDLSDAIETLDASGLTVTPGFIDSHSHSDGQILTRPDMVYKIEQGITTSIDGQCGSSVFPLERGSEPSSFREIPGVGDEFTIRSDTDVFFDTVTSLSYGSNQALLVGHGSLRRAVMGFDMRKPTEEELEQMKALLRKALERGAFGLSFGLYYVPGAYAETEECVELAKVVSEYGRVVTAHIRDEGDRLVESVEEFLTILKEANVRGVISHHKASTSDRNWGKVHHTLRMIEEANRSGMDVYCDVYPYVACSTSLRTAFIPKEDFSGGIGAVTEFLKDPAYCEKIRLRKKEQYGNSDLSWVLVTICKNTPEFEGKRIDEIAKELNVEPIDAVIEVLLRNEMIVSSCFFSISEDDMRTVLRFPRSMGCTDSGIPNASVFHPRVVASFPRLVGRYAIEEKVVALPEMIRKLTAMPARVYGFSKKGLIWEGMDADVCIFDEKTFRDKATFLSCKERAEGLKYVLVNGKTVVKDAVFNGECYGKVLLAK